MGLFAPAAGLAAVWVGTPGVACEAFFPSEPRARALCHRPISPLYSAKLPLPEPHLSASPTPLNLQRARSPRTLRSRASLRNNIPRARPTVSRQRSQNASKPSPKKPKTMADNNNDDRRRRHLRRALKQAAQAAPGGRRSNEGPAEGPGSRTSLSARRASRTTRAARRASRTSPRRRASPRASRSSRTRRASPPRSPPPPTRRASRSSAPRPCARGPRPSAPAPSSRAAPRRRAARDRVDDGRRARRPRPAARGPRDGRAGARRDAAGAPPVPRGARRGRAAQGQALRRLLGAARRLRRRAGRGLRLRARRGRPLRPRDAGPGSVRGGRVRRAALADAAAHRRARRLRARGLAARVAAAARGRGAAVAAARARVAAPQGAPRRRRPPGRGDADLGPDAAGARRRGPRRRARAAQAPRERDVPRRRRGRGAAAPDRRRARSPPRRKTRARRRPRSRWSTRTASWPSPRGRGPLDRAQRRGRGLVLRPRRAAVAGAGPRALLRRPRRLGRRQRRVGRVRASRTRPRPATRRRPAPLGRPHAVRARPRAHEARARSAGRSPSSARSSLAWAAPVAAVPRALGLGPRTRIVVVSATANHALFVTAGGRALSSGVGAFGRLGHGDEADAPAPRPVRALRHVRVVAAAAGAAHSLFAAAGGDVYACGQGEDGRLGLGRPRDEELGDDASSDDATTRLRRAPPRRASSGRRAPPPSVLPRGRTADRGGDVLAPRRLARVGGARGVRDVVAGAHQRDLVTHAGGVLSCGHNAAGQLSRLAAVLRPGARALPGRRPHGHRRRRRGLDARRRFVDATGRAFACGSNARGALGLGRPRGLGLPPGADAAGPGSRAARARSAPWRASPRAARVVGLPRRRGRRAPSSSARTRTASLGPRTPKRTSTCRTVAPAALTPLSSCWRPHPAANRRVSQTQRGEGKWGREKRSRTRGSPMSTATSTANSL